MCILLTEMKSTYLAIALLFFAACKQKPTEQQPESETIQPVMHVETEQFQGILDSALLNGAILVYDPIENLYYSNNFEYTQQGSLPASTFKIVNSIIGLEIGAITLSDTFKYDGEKRRMKIWEKDFDLHGAYHASCVPCYQELARKIGVKNMQRYVTKFDYGNMAIDSSSIDQFWLTGDSKISQQEQINFLKRLKNDSLPITSGTRTSILNIMLLDQNKDYSLRGKTGWSIRDGNNVGWFVGWIERGDKTYYVATKVEPQEDFDMDTFARIRLQVSLEALRAMNFIN